MESEVKKSQDHVDSTGSNLILNILPAASSGTVTINADSTVQILAEEAHPLDRFDQQVNH